ncbi:hypothetical protein [Streptomyces sp. NPDC048442]|uniref:hypothetical protein n=1 Tax=Streptomyces sp. NPDC048442 TaxID=3154823 RepID=UPI0034129729
MTAAHGAWGSVVIDDQGRVVLNAEYAAVAKTQRFDVLAWTCASSDAGELVQDLTGEYGVYDWSGLEEQAPVWNQHIVQPNRLREHSSKAKADRSATSPRCGNGSSALGSPPLPGSWTSGPVTGSTPGTCAARATRFRTTSRTDTYRIM